MTMLPPDPKFLIRHDSPITCLIFSCNQPLLYSGCLSGEVKIWSLETYRSRDSIKCGEESIQSIHTILDDNGEDLVIQDKMGVVSRWANKDGEWKQTWTFQITYMGFCQSRVMDDTIVSPNENAGIQYNSLLTGEKTRRMSLSAKDVSGELMVILPFTRNSEKYILTGTERGDICIWDWKGQTGGSSLRLEECVMTIAFDPNRMRGAAAGPGGDITTFSVTPSGVVAARVVQIASRGVAAAVLRPDTKILAVGCWDGKLRLLSWKSFVSLAILTTHDDSIQTVAFSNNSPYLLAAGCKDGIISIWDLYNGR